MTVMAFCSLSLIEEEKFDNINRVEYFGTPFLLTRRNLLFSKSSQYHISPHEVLIFLYDFTTIGFITLLTSLLDQIFFRNHNQHRKYST